MTARLSDRIAGAIFLALALWYGTKAGDFSVSFGDPVGPARFPQLLAIPMGLLALIILVRPDPNPVWVRSWPAAMRQLTLLMVLLVYPLAIEPLGFPLSTFIATSLLVRVLGGDWLQAALAGLVIGPGLFVTFDMLLGLPLPFAPAL